MVALFKRNKKEQGVTLEAPQPMGGVVEPSRPEAAPMPSAPEAAPQPEQAAPEQLPAAEPGAEAAPLPRGKRKSKQAPQAQQQPAQPAQKTETRKEIELVLSDGLAEVYQSMTPEEQEKFRKSGEEAAGRIEELVVTFKATARRVLEIIRGWLSTIPRVNKYFLEQESKIKTDEIIQLQREYRKDQRSKVEIK